MFKIRKILFEKFWLVKNHYNQLLVVIVARDIHVALVADVFLVAILGSRQKQAVRYIFTLKVEV